MSSPSARQVAFSILITFAQQEDGRLDGLLGSSSLQGSEAALARELVYGVVRQTRLYDRLAAPFVKQPMQIPLAVALRLACHQLFALDRIPAHAVGSTTTNLMKGKLGRWRGVVNAVVRKLAAKRLTERRLMADGTKMPGPLGRLDDSDWPQDLAERYSLPSELVAKISDHVPESSWPWLNQVPPLATRQRDLCNAVHENESAIARQSGPWTWWLKPGTALRGPVAQGEALVQDYSQGLAIALADPQSGELVCDCCAAPGGKTALLQDYGCEVISADLGFRKLSKMNGARLAMDASRPALRNVFSLVVCDAPCSNSGVFARRPEAQARYLPDNLNSLIKIQQSVLLGAADLVAPGGRLLYSTCSLDPEENQGVAYALSGWHVIREETHWPNQWSAGGYAAVLVRDN